MIKIVAIFIKKNVISKTLLSSPHNKGHFTHKTESLWPANSSILIGGIGGAGPSLLHTTLEGPTEYVNARWM